MNTDEALKCLKIAQRYRDSGDYASARKFAQKSINLESTPEALKLLEIITKEASSSSKASGAETHASSSTTSSRAHPKSKASESSGGTTEKATYTEAQIKLVRRVRNCKVTDYYEILELEKTCEEGDVKKAYRKLALQLHPDKNNAPGADEAFKMVSKAFQVLSDPQKRAAFDQSGGDPEARFGAGSSGMAQNFAGARQFDGEISPEELFNMFFGGGMNGGGGFGGGPIFTASFGPGGFRTTRMRAGNPRAAANEPQSLRTIFLQLAPLLLLFMFSFMGSLPNLFTTPPPPNPSYTFSPVAPYTSGRVTASLDIPYYVVPAEFSAHPIYSSIPQQYQNDPKAGVYSRQLLSFERGIEQHWTNQMMRLCEHEIQDRNQRADAKRGIFGIGADWEAVRRIGKEKLDSCEMLLNKKLISRY